MKKYRDQIIQKSEKWSHQMIINYSMKGYKCVLKITEGLEIKSPGNRRKKVAYIKT